MNTSPTRRFAVALTLVAITLLAYSNSFRAGFSLDNKALILQDARVHAPTRANVDLILSHTYWWPIGESGLYRPVTTLSYLFNYAVLGSEDQPAGYHGVNLILHMINVLMVYALTRRIADRGMRIADSNPRNPQSTIQSAIRSPQSAIRSAFFMSAIWAVHPLSTEAVTNIVGRADLLAACAVLSGLLMYARSTETTGARRVLWLAGLAATTTVGVFAKESAVVIVACVVLYALCGRSAKAAHSIRGSLPFAALIALAIPLQLLWYQRSVVLGAAAPAEFPFVDNPIAGAGFWTGRLTAVAVMARCVWLVVWPVTLSADYSYAQIPLATGRLWEWVAWIVMALAAAGTVALWRGNRAASFYAAFAFITFAPASNLFFPAGTIMAERVMYLPSLGIIGLVVLALESASRRLGRPAIALIAVCAIVAGCTLRTWNRNRDWQSDLTLWSAAVEASPRSFKAHRGLAEALYEQDPAHANIGQVVDEIEKSVAVLASLPAASSDARTYRQAAAYYLEQGDHLGGTGNAQPSAERIRAYEKAVPMLTHCLAIIEAARGPSTAGPRADAYRLLSAVYTRLGNVDTSVDAAVRARELDPMSPVSYQQEAAALLAAERGDAAAVALMVGSMVTGARPLRDELVDLYRRGLDPRGCAVVSTPNGPAIDPSCETVRAHVCAATAEAIAILQRMGRGDDARRLQEGTSRQIRCS